MKEKECKNMYKVCVADYLFSILNKLKAIDMKITEIINES